VEMLMQTACIAAALAYAPPLGRPTRLPASTVARSAPIVAQDVAATKSDLMRMLMDGLRTPKDLQGDINEALLTIERTNPTSSPAQSPLLNGVWALQYAGALAPGVVDSPTRELALSIYSSSYNAGVLKELLNKLPFDASLNDVTISIASMEAGQPRVSTEAAVSLLGAPRSVKFFCNLQPISGVRLREVFIEGEAFGFRSLLPGPLSFSRQLFVTFLDDELCILRDESGVADVLVRKEAFVGSGEPEGDAPAAS